MKVIFMILLIIAFEMKNKYILYCIRIFNIKKILKFYLFN